MVQRALRWAYVWNWGHRGVSSTLTLILAALLGPTAFGVVAMGMAYIALVEMLLEQGFTAAIMQRKDLQPQHLDSIFWLVLVVSGPLCAASIVAGEWWAHANRLPELGPVIAVLSLTIPIHGLTIVQHAIFGREMDFKSLAIRANCAALFGGVVGVSMAIAGFGYWALVAQRVSEVTAGLILLWSLSHWRPRLRFSSKHARELIGFSSATFVGQLGRFAGLRADVVIIGLFFGPTVVGLYRLAARLVNTLLVVFTRPLEWVALPHYSRMQDDPAELRRALLKSLRLSGLASFPLLGLLAGVSDPLLACLGEQWAAAAQPLQILCLAGMFAVVSLFVAPLVQAIARPQIFLAVTWISAICNAVAILTASVLLRGANIEVQLAGVAGAVLVIAVLVTTPMSLVLYRRCSAVSARDVMAAIGWFGASAIAAAFASGVVSTIGSGLGFAPFPVLVAAGIAGGLAGISAVVLFDGEARSGCLDLFRRVSGRQIAT